jgi:hypothetical protein
MARGAFSRHRRNVQRWVLGVMHRSKALLDRWRRRLLQCHDCRRFLASTKAQTTLCREAIRPTPASADDNVGHYPVAMLFGFRRRIVLSLFPRTIDTDVRRFTSKYSQSDEPGT